MLRSAVLAAGFIGIALPASADTITIDLAKQYGPSYAGLQLAINHARDTLLKDGSGNVVTIVIPQGTFDFSGGPVKGVIDVSNIRPGPHGQLVIRGAGTNLTSDSDFTTLKFSRSAIQIYGVNAANITFRGIHFTTVEPSVSQGYVVSASATEVALRIPPGFPSPDQIYDSSMSIGRYLRRCSAHERPPKMLQTENEQLPWTAIARDPKLSNSTGDVWRFTLGKINLNDPALRATLAVYANTSVPQLVAIKSKSKGQTYWFNKSENITFDHVKWTRKARGVFRGGSKNIRFDFVQIRRDKSPDPNQAFCLSTPDGGPQFGQPNDPETSGNTVDHFEAEGTGDDAIAFFNNRWDATTGSPSTVGVASKGSDGRPVSNVPSNVDIRDSFGRGILLYRSPNVVLGTYNLIRAPLLRTDTVGATED